MISRVGLRIVLVLIGGVVGVALTLLVVRSPHPPPVQAVWIYPSGETPTHTIHIPLVLKGYVPPSGRLCRFGLGAGTDIGSYAVNDLRIGWYIDWTATCLPARPGGITYVPIIRLRQTGPDSYSYFPAGNTLSATVMANPGALWLIGNEPDRRHWQDSLEPRIYAQAYHELYYLIKSMDPEAQIGAGGIVQPTPLRLRYLDMVLDHYRALYGEPMPVDVWNIHAFILRERNCDCFPDDCWGAEIPPGIDDCEGMLYEIQDNDNLEIFKQHIERFREWMAQRGFQDRPLMITEFGVQMWPDYGFPPERVNAFMNATFDYLMTMTSTLGYPADGYRLVQRWAWYSLNDDNFNGWLFDPETKARTVFGDNFAAYTAHITPTVNLAPVRIWTDPPVMFSSGSPLTLTLYAAVVNNGHVATDVPATVRLYGDGVLIGERFVPDLDGCGAKRIVTVTWSNVSPGTHSVQVEVDGENRIAELNEADNVLSAPILIASVRLWLPMVLKSVP